MTEAEALMEIAKAIDYGLGNIGAILVGIAFILFAKMFSRK